MGGSNALRSYLDKYTVSFKTVAQRKGLAKSQDYRKQIVALAKECPEEFSLTVRQVHEAHQKALLQSFKNKGLEKELGETHVRPSSQHISQEEPDEQDEEHEDRLRIKVEQTLEQSPFLNKDSDEDALSVSSAETKDSAQDVMSEQESRHEKELKLLSGELPEPLRQRCLSEVGEPNHRLDHKEKSLNRLTDKLARFDTEIARVHVVDFLSKRLQQPGLSQFPDLIQLSNPGDLVHALELVDAHAEDVNLHRAFGQIKLYLSVKMEAEKRQSQGTSLAIRKSVHTQILEQWAFQKVKGPVNVERSARIRKACQKHYNAGLNWLHLIKCFGGQGIIFFFVMAGINPGEWVDYQRQCLKLIARELHEVKRMVTALGGDCLSDYCEKGFIAQPVVDGLKALDLYPDGDRIEDDEDTPADVVAWQKRISDTSKDD